MKIIFENLQEFETKSYKVINVDNENRLLTKYLNFHMFITLGPL